jgi:ribosomal protein S18 acetylase RimI-like enzyme
MAWKTTNSLDAFLDTAGEYLRSDPVGNTVPLTVLETLRQSGLGMYGDHPPVFGWHEPDSGGIDAAFLQTPPFHALLSSLPDGSADSFVELLTAGTVRPTGVNVPAAEESAIAAAWVAATGGGTSAHLRSRLFRLADLMPPDPFPPGAARVAGPGDTDLLVDWSTAFVAETGSGGGDQRKGVADRLSYRGFTLWETGGVPVAMAALTRNVAGVVRVGMVYTPPGHRRRGYGGAVTTAVSQAAFDGGAAQVVLFTDLANPTSNALYQRLGYRPVADRVQLELRDVTGAPAASSFPS